MDIPVLVDQQILTVNQLCEDTGCSQDDRQGEMDDMEGERERERERERVNGFCAIYTMIISQLMHRSFGQVIMTLSSKWFLLEKFLQYNPRLKMITEKIPKGPWIWSLLIERRLLSTNLQCFWKDQNIEAIKSHLYARDIDYKISTNCKNTCHICTKNATQWEGFKVY